MSPDRDDLPAASDHAATPPAQESGGEMSVALVADWLEKRVWIAGRVVKHPVEGGREISEWLARDLLRRLAP